MSAAYSIQRTCSMRNSCSRITPLRNHIFSQDLLGVHLTIALDMSLLLAILVLAIGSRSIPLSLEVSGYHALL